MTISFNKSIILHFMTVMIMLGPILSVAQKKVNYRNVPQLDSAVGYASFYSNKFIGKKTANGEVFSQDKLTCAHNSLPMGTILKVTNLNNDKSVVVRVNDRMHHRNSRLVDLSRTAAQKLDFKGIGVIKVRVEVQKRG
ncbi:MAG: septal ring lytic transglycosylase RlpA family protein [bacterium]|jgi:rare lipoprotein A|nr:septal ring lytic transglycosylase RlpA family protein [Chitinophagaceae bacterium]